MLDLSPLKLRNELENKVDRRNFFEKIGKASLIVAAATVLPIKLFGSKKRERANKNIKVKIHPSAVKRNKV